MVNNKEWKYIGFALTIYILAIPLNGFLKLPVLGDKLQLPEIIFLFLSTLTLLKVIKHKSWLKWRVTKIDKALIVYGLALLISCLTHLTRASFFEFLGFIYLVCLYLTINIYLIESGEKIRLQPHQIKSFYVEQVGKFTDTMKARCLQYKIDFVECDINAGFKDILQTYLVKRTRMNV